MKLTKLLTTSALVCASVTFATPLAAQSTSPANGDNATDADAPEALAQSEVDLESGQATDTNQQTITVTGTRIRSPNLTSSVPITSIGIQELTDTGDVSLGDQLNELPALRSTFSQSNSTRFIGTAGLSILDLRGLGTARTLVLVNGRRHVTSQPGNGNVDVNTIPTDLVERVDIVTGGNSAIYGSDAVAGVVNFVLKRDYDGFRIRAQGGISDKGDRGSYFVSATGGKNFGDGRGNIAANLEYTQSRAVYYTQRDEQYGAFRGRDGFFATENTIGEPATGNGTPDRSFLRNVSNIGLSEGGAFTSTCPALPAATATAAQRNAILARRALNCTGGRGPAAPGVLGPELGRVFVFDQSGNLVPNDGDLDLRPFGAGNVVNGLGSTLRLTGQLQPAVKRYAANVLAHFEISPALRPFVEAKFVRVDSIQEGQPTFSTAALATTFQLNNPFLSDQARSLLTTSLPAGATSFTTSRFNVDLGGRGEDHRRDTYRIVAGIDGTFNEDWRYEIAGNYGRLKTFYETEGNILLARFARSVNAVRNASGQIVCAVNANAITTDDDPACVPVNLFGFGAPSQEAIDYFGVTSSRRQRASQLDFTAFVSGDLSQLFEFPGGPIGFAVGGEYRKEKSFSDFDDVTQSGATFLNIIPTFDPPNLVVKEAFGELRFPLLAELPFAHELTIEAAGRVSDYNIGSTGTVFAYNVGGIYAPVRDVRLRAGYARSVRAPTQTNLFGAQSQTFLNNFNDPCGQQNINNNPNRVRNCAAAGVPTTQTFTVGGAPITEPFTNNTASGISGFNGSNPLLNEEKGTSYTVGAVIQPRFVPGLSLSVDYYKITIDNVIFSLAPQTIIDQCYDSPSGIDNPFCAVLRRNANGTFAGQSNVRLNSGTVVDFPTTGASFISGPFNFAKQKTSGIDADVAYRTNIFGDVKLNLRGLVSYLIERDNFTDINRPEFRDQQKLELGDPEWEGSLSADLDFGVVDFGYDLRYIGRQTIDVFEGTNSLQGRPPENPDRDPRRFYPDVFYHDIRVGFEPKKGSKIYFGVDNVFDRQPPFGLDGTGEGSGIFENVGRFFYAGAEVTF